MLRKIRNVSLNKNLLLDTNTTKCLDCKFYIGNEKCNLYIRNNRPIYAFEARKNNYLCGLNGRQFKSKSVWFEAMLVGVTGTFIGICFGKIIILMALWSI
jgi:hypothetical protein